MLPLSIAWFAVTRVSSGYGQPREGKNRSPAHAGARCGSALRTSIPRGAVLPRTVASCCSRRRASASTAPPATLGQQAHRRAQPNSL